MYEFFRTDYAQSTPHMEVVSNTKYNQDASKFPMYTIIVKICTSIYIVHACISNDIFMHKFIYMHTIMRVEYKLYCITFIVPHFMKHE